MVLFVIILGLLAAIVIPRLGGAPVGRPDATLSRDLALLRDAIDRYAADHGGYPIAAEVSNQLTQYTDARGNFSAVRDGNFPFGPYLRKVPPLPVGAKGGSSGMAAADGAGVGWIYAEATGTVRANTTTERDSAGTLYSNY